MDEQSFSGVGACVANERPRVRVLRPRESAEETDMEVVKMLMVFAIDADASILFPKPLPATTHIVARRSHSPQHDDAFNLCLSPSHHQAMAASLVANLGQGVECEGWVLKKRRRRMQGFARRYFVLHSSGILSYSYENGQPTRDRVSTAAHYLPSDIGNESNHLEPSGFSC